MADQKGAYANFLVTDAVEIMSLMARAQARSFEVGMPEIGAALARMATQMALDLRQISEWTAGLADELIVERIVATKGIRPEAAGEHLDEHIQSGILPLGTVQVAYIDELDKVVNTEGYGPYWRAQEAGTGSFDPEVGPVASQVDRVLMGTYGFGDGSRPDPSKAGVGVGDEGQFVPGGGDPGFGTIHHELPARHFLRDGTNEAWAFYGREMDAFQDKWVAQVNEVKALIATVGLA